MSVSVTVSFCYCQFLFLSFSVPVFFHWWYRNVLVCMDSIDPGVNMAISSARKSTGVNFEAVLHCFFDNCFKFFKFIRVYVKSNWVI